MIKRHCKKQTILEDFGSEGHKILRFSDILSISMVEITLWIFFPQNSKLAEIWVTQVWHLSGPKILNSNYKGDFIANGHDSQHKRELSLESYLRGTEKLNMTISRIRVFPIGPFQKWGKIDIFTILILFCDFFEPLHRDLPSFWWKPWKYAQTITFWKFQNVGVAPYLASESGTFEKYPIFRGQQNMASSLLAR